MTSRTIRVDEIARVEGGGSLVIELHDDRPADVRLDIFEPPRFFESLLRGRSFMDAPDLTARICGICPAAYQMSACHAMEAALGVTVGPEIRSLRRLLYAGEWIESHALHVVMLHAPDFLGFPDAVTMAKDHGDLVRRGLRMKKAGNAIMKAVGGREIHPVNVRVGGFWRAPSRDAVRALSAELAWGRDAARELALTCAQFSFPALQRDYELVALRGPGEYPLCEGRVVSTRGLDIDVSDYPSAFVETQVPHSTALHSKLRARGSYLCGALARFALNHDLLRPLARETAAAAGLIAPCLNPYQSLLVRAVEMVQAFDEALALVDAYEPPARPFVDAPPRAGVGCACTEAPRGILFHRYVLDADGIITDATIVPPTSQNQATIEDDLRAVVPELLRLPKADAARLAERIVRNHDPCISCATHFLTLRVENAP